MRRSGRRGAVRGIGSAVAAVAVLAPGCFWGAPGQGADRRAHNPFEDAIGVDTVAALEPLWSVPVGAPAGDPVTSTVGVHLTGGGALHGVGHDGTALWTHEGAANEAMLQPFVHGDRLYAGRWEPDRAPGPDALQDVTVVVDAATGAHAAPAQEGLVAAVRGDEVLLWDAFTSQAHGAYRWYHRTNLLDLAAGTWAGPLGPFDMDVNVGGGPSAPSGVTLGRSLVLAAAGSQLQAYPKVPGDPGCFEAFDCPAWRASLPGEAVGEPVLGEDGAVAYMATQVGVVAVRVDDGAVLWSASFGRRPSDAPALAGGALFVPTGEGDLVALDAATGALRWSGPTGSRIAGQPAVAGGVVVTGSDDGGVRAFAADGCGGATTCGSLWSSPAGGPITGAPAISGGRVYVGTGDGRLVAFGLAQPPPPGVPDPLPHAR